MTAKVAHPILRLVVVRPDGARSVEQRVFCRYQRKSIDAETCYACNHCDAVRSGVDPAIECTIPVDPEEARDLDMVGAVLQRGTVALDPGASIGEALELLRAADRRSLAVVDDRNMLVGVLHEVAFVRPAKDADEVAAAMSSALALHESTPVRRALRLLASAHLREAAIVDDEGHPLGVFRDVDGLRLIALRRDR